MSSAEIILIATVVCVVLPAAIRNLTAVALGASWALSFIAYWGFGHVFSLTESVYIDMAVIAVIMCKTDQSFIDYCVITLFIPAWSAYFFADDPWWPVWWICMAQYFLVGGEALLDWFARRPAKPRAEYRDETEFRALGGAYG